MKKVSIILVLLLVLSACSSAIVPEPTPTSAPLVANERYETIFEIVWRTVNAGFYDPTFGGRDWTAIGDQYRPQAVVAGDDESFFVLVNQMLGELGVSHLEVVPPGGWEHIQPTLFAPGSPGIDLRLLDGAAVITRVRPDSPAAQAGLQPGYIIQEVDGATIVEIVKSAGTGPALAANERMTLNRLTGEILGRIYGSAGTTVSITYLDETEVPRQAQVERAARERQARLGDVLPPLYLEFETQRLDDGVVYVWFNTFHPALLASVMTAIDEAGETPGLILDLRGNIGGSTNATEVLVRYFLDQQTNLCRLKARERAVDWMIYPQENTYDGPIVVLLDVLSSSASELFAGCLQGIGRAAVAGERSPGSALAASLQALPGGAALLYPMVEIQTMQGIVLEGYGVIPDIEAVLSRQALLQGGDPQIEAALEYLAR